MTDSATREPVVEVSGLTVRLAGSPVAVVEDVSFTIPTGAVLGLVGESGSGKSTVGLALLAYARAGLEIAGGTVRIGDTEMLSLSASALRHVRGRLVGNGVVHRQRIRPTLCDYAHDVT